jgi:hypothetical protein
MYVLLLSAGVVIYSEMKKESTQEKGFIIWLDFTKVSKHSIDLLARPVLLPVLPADGDEKHSSKIKKLIDEARITASIAVSILHDVKKTHLDCSKNLRRSIVDVTEDFESKILSAQEFNWYKARDTWEKVLNISSSLYYLNFNTYYQRFKTYNLVSCFNNILVRKSQDDELAEPWELLRLPKVPERDISTETATQQAELFEAVRVANAKLVRKRQGQYGVEVLSRDGFDPNAVNAVKCIFGFLLENDGCKDDAKYRCDVCSALCCDFHKEHSRHSEVSSHEQILKQHIAYQSLDQSINQTKNLNIESIPTASSANSDPNVGNTTSAALESSTHNKDTGDSSEAVKKPARDTKADLFARYKNVKGHAWNGDGNITAKALKILVRELEGQASGKATTTTANTPTPIVATINTSERESSKKKSKKKKKDEKKSSKSKSKRLHSSGSSNSSSSSSESDSTSSSTSSNGSKGSNKNGDLLLQLKTFLSKPQMQALMSSLRDS